MHEIRASMLAIIGTVNRFQFDPFAHVVVWTLKSSYDTRPVPIQEFHVAQVQWCEITVVSCDIRLLVSGTLRDYIHYCTGKESKRQRSTLCQRTVKNISVKNALYVSNKRGIAVGSHRRQVFTSR